MSARKDPRPTRFSEWLRATRLLRLPRQSQAAAAASIGVGPAHLARWETGAMWPSDASLDRIVAWSGDPTVSAELLRDWMHEEPVPLRAIETTLTPRADVA